MLTPEQISQIRAQSGYAGTPAPSPVQAPTVDRVAELRSSLKPEGPNVEADKAFFKATGDESPGMAAAKVVGNLPTSGAHFVKGVADFLNPLNTIKTASGIGESISAGQDEANAGIGDKNRGPNFDFNLAKETVKGLPGAAYDVLVPQFLKHIFSGDLKSAAATLENDPVGQLAPLIMISRGAAEKIGKGAEFDAAMTKIATPITKPAAMLGRGAKAVTSQVLGMSTGAGASSILEGAGSAAEGRPALNAFTEAMRGRTRPNEVIQSAEDVTRSIVDQRRSSYVKDLKRIGEDKTSHDISPITSELDSQLGNFGVKIKEGGSLDFSRSSIANNGSARADIQGVYDTVKDWGTKSGDRTGIGLDLLKKQLGDFYSDSSQARAFVQAVKGKVSDLLAEKVPGYKTMTSKYAEASTILDDIKSATGAGKDAKPDAVFTKLTSAMKRDNEFRIEVLKEMEKVDPYLMNKIAGINLSSWIPRGLVGKSADVGAAFSVLLGHFNPSVIPMLLSTSPRIVGEFIRTAGIAVEKGKSVSEAISKLAKYDLNVDKMKKDITAALNK